MNDKLELAASASAGVFGWAIGMSMLQTVVVVLITCALHSFVLALMGWKA